ncbi:MAG: DUF502 domain-containing protein [Phycisphaerae bacterium]
MKQQRFTDDFRRFFLRGLGALVPTLLTFAILVWAFRLINDNVGHYITRGLLSLCIAIRDEPSPGFVDPDVDLLRYGHPINEWDERGRRLTIEYKIVQNYNFLLEKGLRESKEKKLEKPEKDIVTRARRERNEALWGVAFFKYHFHLLSFLIAIILVYFTGFFLASFIGRTSWRAAEGLLNRIPLIRAVYSNVKQVTDFLLSDHAVEFSGVVAVQYPRKGIWSVGLRTGTPMRQVQSRVSEPLVTVFIPSSPTPITGYVIQVAEEDVIELNMTIDEGLRFTISGGVIKPGAELPAPSSPPTGAPSAGRIGG